MDVLKMGQSKVSRHLSYLRKAGLVQSRKDGLWVHYSLSKPAGEFHKRLLSCLDCCLTDVADLSRDVKALEVKNKKKAGCC
jgi:ArsR family transcriptional regulator